MVSLSDNDKEAASFYVSFLIRIDYKSIQFVLINEWNEIRCNRVMDNIRSVFIVHVFCFFFFLAGQC